MDHDNPYESPPDLSDGAADSTRAASAVATIRPMDEPYCGRLLTRGIAMRANLLNLLPILGLLVAILLLEHDSRNPGATVWSEWRPVVLGCLLLLLGVGFAFWYLLFFESLYYNRRVRRVLRLRPSPLVRADDREATCVGIVPRENLATVIENLVHLRWDLVNDIGLLKADARRSAVLFEGSQEQYTIPGGSILLCTVMEAPWPGNPVQQLHLVRLVIQLEDAQREILVLPNSLGWRPYTRRRRRQLADKMCQRIRDFMPSIEP